MKVYMSWLLLLGAGIPCSMALFIVPPNHLPYLGPVLYNTSSIYICRNYPYCFMDRGTGVWSDTPTTSSSSDISRDKKPGESSEQDWFTDFYCSPTNTNVLKSLTNIGEPAACEMECKKTSGCEYFTFREVRNHLRCSLLSACSVKSRCTVQKNCVSGHITHNCPALALAPADSTTVELARWSCGEVDPYKSEIPSGTVCQASCPGSLAIQSTCGRNGKWTPSQSTSVQLTYLREDYPSPDQPDMECGCKSLGLFNYNPNDEPGASFICSVMGPEDMSGTWSITAADTCHLYCDGVPEATISCQNNKWTGEPQKGIWCYEPPSPPPDCQVTGWSTWSECSTTCGWGKRSRRRTISQDKYFGGAKCPDLSESTSCNIDKCPAPLLKASSISMSSVLRGEHKFRGENCIDGDLTGEYCFTGNDPAPWIALDFTTPVRVEKVVLIIRDTTRSYLKNVEVRQVDKVPSSADSMYREGHQVGSVFTGPGTRGEPAEFINGDNSVSSRYVLVQMDYQSFLNFYEIQVYGH